MSAATNLAAALDRINDLLSPQPIGRVNDPYLAVAKGHGELI